LTTGEAVPKPELQLLLYKVITAADVRKLQARSNDSGTGGGARDLRLPFARFDGVMSELLPQTRTEPRRRNGVVAETLVRYGTVRTNAGRPFELTWEPPTTARPHEGRLARVHAALTSPKDDPALGRVLLFLRKDTVGVFASYAYEQELKDPKLWGRDFAAEILSSLDDPGRRGNRPSVQGHIDFTAGKHYRYGLDDD
jgi:hypothetical protein